MIQYLFLYLQLQIALLDPLLRFMVHIQDFQDGKKEQPLVRQICKLLFLELPTTISVSLAFFCVIFTFQDRQDDVNSAQQVSY